MSDFKDMPLPDRTALGDLDDLLRSETSSGLDWLDVNEETYRALDEVLPRQNLDTVPELERAWAQLGQDAPGALARVPLNQGGWRPSLEAPFWSERADAPGAADQRRAQRDLLLKMRSLMEEGLVGEGLLEALRAAFSEDALEREARLISAARARWEGRLGHLYVDADLHEDCRSGKGARSASLKAAIAHKAPYAVEATKCGGCVLAQEGRCSVLNKELVHRIDLERSPLTEEDWTKARAASALVSALSKSEVAAVREAHPSDVGARMRKAALLADGKLRRARNKVAQDDGTSLSARVAAQPVGAGLSRAEVLKRLKSAAAPDPLRLAKVAERERLQRFAEALLTRGSAEVLDVRLASVADPRMAVLAEEAPLFGQLYVDLSYWPTKAAALKAIQAAPAGVKQVPFLIGTPGGAPQSLDFGTPAVQQVVFTRWAATQGCTPDVIPRPFRKLAEEFSAKAAGMDAASWKRFALEAYSTPLPQVARQYADLASWRMTQADLSWGQVKAALASAPAAPAALEDPRPRVALHKMLSRMAAGEHGDALLAEADLLPAPLARQARFHHGLLGRLYSVPEVGQVKTASGALPVKGADQSWASFLSSEPVMNRLAARAVAVWGPAKAEVVIKAARTPEALLKVARTAWSLPLVRREWQGPVVYKEAARLLADQALALDWDQALALGKVASARSARASSDWAVPVAGSDNLLARRVATTPGAPAHAALADWSHGRTAPLWAPLAHGVTSGKRVDAVLQVKTASNGALAEAARDSARQGLVAELFRREEGLLGGAYILASAAEDCRKGARSRTARRVLAQDRCTTCTHRQVNGSCGVYGLPLVKAEDLTYDVRDLRLAASAAQARGVMSERQAARVVSSAQGADQSALRGLIKSVHLWDRPLAASTGARGWTGPVQTLHVSGGGVDVQAEVARLVKWAGAQVDQGAYRQDVVRGVQAGWSPEVVKLAVKELRPLLERAPKAQAALLTASSQDAATALPDLQAYGLGAGPSEEGAMDEAMREALSAPQVKSAGLAVSLEGGEGGWSLDGLWDQS
jgi:hypothetical protein